MYYQERETVRWTEKLKTMGSRALGDNSRGDCEVDKRVVVTDVSNVKVIEGMAETTSETPIKVISSDIRTLRNGNNNGGRMIRVFRHTLGRRIPADGGECQVKRSQKILTYLYLCARCSKIQSRLRMGKSKRG